jgi:hypothetical protein
MRAPQQIKYKGHIYKRAEIDEKRALALTTKLLQQLGAAKTTAEQLGKTSPVGTEVTRLSEGVITALLQAQKVLGISAGVLWPEQRWPSGK